MKLSRSWIRSLVVVVMLACLMASSAPAFGALEDPWGGTSTTNPNAGDDAYWRETWGNSLWPNIVVTQVPTDGDPTVPTSGFLYDLSRIERDPQPGSPIADVTWDPSGTLIDKTFDLQTIYNHLSPAERTWVPVPGQVIHNPIEGVWKLNMRYYNRSRLSTVTWSLDLGIDVTPPRPIVGWTAVEPATTEHGRRTYSWQHQKYDDLSGAYWYELFLNGVFVRRVEVIDWLPPRATLETIPPGVNTVGIRVMDRATNVSKLVTRTEIVDPDVPVVSIASPGSNQYLAGVHTFEAKATDSACSPRVVIKIDGRVWRDLKRGPYRLQVDTRWLSDGYHTMTVTAKDLIGHSRTMTRGFYVDNRRIRMSSISDSPDPFYPVKRDGIKDVTNIQAYLDDGATDLFLHVYDDDQTTKVLTKHWTSVGRGTFRTTWDGKNASGMLAFSDGITQPLTKTCYYQWTARDRAGNWTVSGKYPVTYRNYEVVPNGRGSVRIVWR